MNVDSFLCLKSYMYKHLEIDNLQIYFPSYC